jgi:hypothetical protein
MIKINLTDADLSVITQNHWNALQKKPYDIQAKLRAFGRQAAPPGARAEHDGFCQELRDNLEKILTGKPDLLQRMARKIGRPYQQVLMAIKTANPAADVADLTAAYNVALKQVFDYDRFVERKRYGAYKLALALAVNVCPYCNRQYTFTLDGKKGKVRPEFDHFLDKATHPYLALSLFNLVPSCHICNSNLKGSEHFSTIRHLNPYTAGFQDVLRFSLDITSIDFINGQRDSFTLSYRPVQGADPMLVRKARANARVFKHIELYINHNDLLEELLKKAYYYTPKRQQSLAEFKKPDQSPLFADLNEVKRFITGVYTNEQDWGKRPMSKLITDIGKELGLFL